MSLFIVNQEANANFLVRRARDFKRFSITSVRSPVSMALELATARRILARETDTLSELFLRTMGRLQNKMIARIITPGRPAVLSAFRRSRWKADTNNALLTGPELLSSRYAPLSGKSEPLSSKSKPIDHYTEDEISKHDFVLTPGRYVSTAEQEIDGEPFAGKMARLTKQLWEQFAESARLKAEIKRNLGGLGYDL
ncbi:hypothetical protein MLC59_12415 [Marinobacter bryozoorum]|uniref:hypothetical protein n=1 Tax=Marinobacter bryozoorum TaxID=256324 RepID=UPI0020069329|nr:hypothetical protein [Marinobacter bryozoorum]MCK7544965.1 hypothetical protein [Marinobacter bryozoorum]